MTTFKSFLLILLLSGVALHAQIVENSISIGNEFDKISMSGNMNLYLQHEDGDAVRIVGSQEDINHITVKEKKGKIIISKDLNLRNKDTSKIDIYLPKSHRLQAVTLKGSGDIVSSEPIHTENEFACALSGSGDMDIAVDAYRVSVVLSGSGDIRLTGNTTEAKYKLSGSGDIDASGLTSDTAEVLISGSGDVDLSSNEISKQSILGSGDVTNH